MKISNYENLTIGDLVCVSECKDSVQFKIIEKEYPGYIISDNPKNESQYIDCCQIKSAIINGKKRTYK